MRRVFDQCVVIFIQNAILIAAVLAITRINVNAFQAGEGSECGMNIQCVPANRNRFDKGCIIAERLREITAYLRLCIAAAADGQCAVLCQLPLQTVSVNADGTLVHFQFADVDPIRVTKNVAGQLTGGKFNIPCGMPSVEVGNEIVVRQLGVSGLVIYIRTKRIFIMQFSSRIGYRPTSGLSCFADQDIKASLEPLHSGIISDKLFQVHVDQPETAEPTELVQLKCNCPQIFSVFAELIIRITPLIQIHTAVKAVIMMCRPHGPHTVNHMRRFTVRPVVHIYTFHKGSRCHNILSVGGGGGGRMGCYGRTVVGDGRTVFTEHCQFADIQPVGSHVGRVGGSITGCHTDVLGIGSVRKVRIQIIIGQIIIGGFVIHVGAEIGVRMQIGFRINNFPGTGLACFADQDIQAAGDPMQGIAADRARGCQIDNGHSEFVNAVYAVQFKCNGPQILSVVVLNAVGIVTLGRIHQAGIKTFVLVSRSNGPLSVDHLVRSGCSAVIHETVVVRAKVCRSDPRGLPHDIYAAHRVERNAVFHCIQFCQRAAVAGNLESEASVKYTVASKTDHTVGNGEISQTVASFESRASDSGNRRGYRVLEIRFSAGIANQFALLFVEENAVFVRGIIRVVLIHMDRNQAGAILETAKVYDTLRNRNAFHIGAAMERKGVYYRYALVDNHMADRITLAGPRYGGGRGVGFHLSCAADGQSAVGGKLPGHIVALCTAAAGSGNLNRSQCLKRHQLIVRIGLCCGAGVTADGGGAGISSPEQIGAECRTRV